MATCLDSYRVILTPTTTQIQEFIVFLMHCGIPNAYALGIPQCIRNTINSWICVVVGVRMTR